MIYGAISGWVAPSIGLKVAYHSVPLGLLTSLGSVVGILLVLTIIDLLIQYKLSE
jgi:hypothetical protein